MGSHNMTPPMFHFMLFTSWTHKHFTEIYCSIAEGTGIYQFSLYLRRQSSSNLEQEHFFPGGNSCSPLSTNIGARLSAVLRALSLA
jgi:hypothetical protein